VFLKAEGKLSSSFKSRRADKAQVKHLAKSSNPLSFATRHLFNGIPNFVAHVTLLRRSRNLLKGSLKAVLMHRATALIAALVALHSLGATVQATQNAQDHLPSPKPRAQRSGDFGSPEEEMLRRAEIRREEETHKEMVERADEAAQVGDQLLNSYRKNNSLTRDDLKRLERLEKLARKIRGGAGGSDDEEELSDPPGHIEDAVTRLVKLTGDLKESVSKTSRLVISANVIQRSNEMIELIRHIRTIKQP